MSKYLFFTLLIALSLSACKDKDGYIIDGKIRGLSDPYLYMTTTGPNSVLQIDTIRISKEKTFTFHSFSDTLKPIIIYMENGTIWTTVWAKNKDKITLSGDINYPELIVARGNETNDLLTRFKESNKELLKEKWDLQLKQSSNMDRTDSLSSKHEGSEYSSKMININQQLQRIVEDFIKQNPTSIASLVLIQDYLIDSDDPKLVQEYLSLISGEASQSQLYLKLQKLTKKLLQTTVGYKAPDFSIFDTKNDTVQLNAMKDRYLLLLFAASWCEMCIAENKELVKLRQTFTQDKLTMVTISLDEDSVGWERFAKEQNISWPQVIDNRGWGSEMVSRFNVTSIPTHILIDKEKTIVARNLTIDSLTVILNEHLK